MVYTLTLGTGEFAEIDAIELANGDEFMLLPSGLSIPDPPLNPVFAGGVDRDGSELSDAHYGNRSITAQLYLRASGTFSINEAVQKVNRFLEQAKRHAITQEGERVTLVYRASEFSELVYFDVLTGGFDPLAETSFKTFGQGFIPSLTLSFTCRYAGRGDVRPVPVSATLTNDEGAVYSIDGVAGDLPAPLQLVLTDFSATVSGTPIQRFMVSIYSEVQGGDPLDRVWAQPFTAVAGGVTTVAEANSFTGNVLRHTPSSDWTTVARATLTGTDALAATAGLTRVLVRVRDNVAILAPSFISGYSYPGGSQAAVTHYYKVTAKNASGETIARNTVGITPSGWWGYRSSFVYWANVNGATSYELYRRIGTSGSWFHRNTTALSFTDTSDSTTGWTAGDAPTGTTAASPSAQFRLRYGPSLDQTENLILTREFFSRVGANFEALEPDRLVNLKGAPAIAGYGVNGVRLDLETRVQGAVSGNVDMDVAMLLTSHGSYAETWVAGYTHPFPQIWVLEQRVDEQLRSVAVDGTNGFVVGSRECVGRLFVQPGANRAFITAFKANNVHNVNTTRFTVAASYTPRYRHVPS